MSLSKEEKKEIITSFAVSAEDTGSPEVQVAVLTNKIKYLTEHMKEHHKDIHSRGGLLAMVSRRKKLLSYLKAKHMDRYKTLVEKLGLRGVK